MAAAQYKLDNLIVIVDYNKRASDPCQISEVMDIAPLKKKWLSFNWDVCNIADGNSMENIYRILLFNLGFLFNEKPLCIISHTKKGMGVPLWEKEGLHLVYGDMLTRGIEEGRRLLAGV